MPVEATRAQRVVVDWQVDLRPACSSPGGGDRAATRVAHADGLCRTASTVPLDSENRGSADVIGRRHCHRRHTGGAEIGETRNEIGRDQEGVETRCGATSSA
jgi:hypothetical protein